jgi:hypothetical protein
MTDSIWLIALLSLVAAIVLAGVCLASVVLAGGLTLRGVVKWVVLFVMADGNVNRRRLRG